MIKKAEFVISNTDVRKCPQGSLPEYAFIGRSNVGKSSLLNMLTGRPGLAKASSKPGKTLLINHFLIDDSWYLVDLPGYGYASAGKEVRAQLQRMIDAYVMQREQLICLFVLIDIRHEPQKIDTDFMQQLGERGVPFAMIFTKADKLSRTAQAEHVEQYRNRMLEQWEELPPMFITSSETRQGRDELIDYIETINASL
ncbi:MAG: YihA family ribosome biogenesis GTP-binding protein [Paludibacteraceae bacterium]|nr:YihA family ribosome biogenesis GTP-binding protein [Paludibacteraceae bacterium]